MTARDPALRMLAQEMAAEEQAHVVLIEELLEHTPEPTLEQVIFP
jgi:rubrerythrin